MPAPVDLYCIPNHYRTYKILVAAKYNGVKVNLPAFDYEKDSEAEWFLNKNPSGKVPLLDTENGTVFESNAIARYFARVRADTELYGSSFYDASQVDQWIDFSCNELELPACIWTYPLLGMMNPNPDAIAKAKEDVENCLKTLNDHLLLRTFLVGNQVTLADIAVACALQPLYTMVLDKSMQEKYVNTTRWFMTCVNQPEFVEVMGTVVLAEKEQTEVKALAKAAAPAGGKKEGKKKEKQPKQPKAEKKAPEPKKEKAPEVLPENMPAAAEPEDFYQDGWKKMFSNNPADVYIPWFWDRITKNDKFSVWKCMAQDADKYMCQPAWMTNNQVNGFVQRAEPLRKEGFGIVGMFGTQSQQEVEGIWVWTGQEYHPKMEGCADAEYYDWVKLDLSKQEDKDLINKYLDFKGVCSKGGNFGKSRYGFADLKPVDDDVEYIGVFK